MEFSCTKCGYAIFNNSMGPYYCPNCKEKMIRSFDEENDHGQEPEPTDVDDADDAEPESDEFVADEPDGSPEGN
jgi:uncharacterized Zn finger protein (UPF0148 family)